ncbi:MAG TPA: hypothetical protein VGJ14_18775 [Sporichthyaceae bacterium]
MIERPSVDFDWELPPEPIEIVAGPVQLRPWEERLVGELAALRGCEELDAVDRRLREWREGVALSFAVQEITTARLLGEVVLHPLPDRVAALSWWGLPEAAGEVAETALGALTRWALGALGAQQVRHHTDPEPGHPLAAQ